MLSLSLSLSQRILGCHTLYYMAATKNAKLCSCDLFIQYFKQCIKDGVPNVQFAASKILAAMKDVNVKVQSEVVGGCRAELTANIKAHDPDVAFYAKLALGQVDELGNEL